MSKMLSFRGLSEEQVARVDELARLAGLSRGRWLVAAVEEKIARADPEAWAVFDQRPNAIEADLLARRYASSRADQFRQAGELAAARRRALKGQGNARET